jgi:4'-phosphopantetheinyl transferase
MNTLDQILKERIVLTDNKIHVYLIQFNLFDDKECIQYLSEDELVRAEKLKIEEKKNQFVIARSVLRLLLSSVVGKSYQDIEFFYGEHGKPSIKESLNKQPIEFNISHSGNYALIAITLSHKVGVDIEEIKFDLDHQSLSKRFFSEQEYSELQRINESQQCDVFYSVWAKKESFIKATGQGVAFGLERFSVSLDEESETGLKVKTPVQLEDDWFTFNLLELYDYKTALTTSTKYSDIIIHK